MMRTDQLLLGIDGGGSKTVAWLALRRQRGPAHVVGRGTAGPSNPLAVGRDVALGHLAEAVEAAFRDAVIARQPAAAATLALAGADRDAVRQSIEQWARDQQLADRVQVVHDALPVLAAATEGVSGVALISGTGALAFGRDAQGRTARAGGWGWLWGDEGSGFALGQAALRAIAAAVDGRGPETALVAAVTHELGASTPRELIAALHGQENPRQRIALLAPLVAQAADSGDATASKILAAAAADLASLVNSVAENLSFNTASFPLALCGGVLVGSTLVREELARQLASRTLRATPTTLVAEPVRGAIRLAERMVSGE